MTNIILGVLFVLFLICLYKIAGLRESIKTLEKYRVYRHEMNDAISDIHMIGKQLMSLRVDFNEFHDHYQHVNDLKVEKLVIDERDRVSKKPAKKKAYGKKNK